MNGFVSEYAGYTIAPVRYSTVADQVRALHDAHWADICEYGEPYAPGEFQPWLEPYLAGEQFVFLVAAREGRVVGYAGYFLTRSTRTGLLSAIEDLFYIHRDHRKGRLAMALTTTAERCLKDLGVRSITATCPLGSPAAKVWQRMGYRKTTEQFVKEI